MKTDIKSPKNPAEDLQGGERLDTPACSLLSIPIETVEGIIFDAMEAMNKHAATLVPVLNEHKSPEASEAYKSGVYAVSMKLGMLIGLDGIERQKSRYAKIEAELKDYFDRRASKANVKGDPRPSEDQASLPPETPDTLLNSDGGKSLGPPSC